VTLNTTTLIVIVIAALLCALMIFMIWRANQQLVTIGSNIVKVADKL
jgi:preprotein translocase subunit YajC